MNGRMQTLTFLARQHLVPSDDYEPFEVRTRGTAHWQPITLPLLNSAMLKVTARWGARSSRD